MKVTSLQDGRLGPEKAEVELGGCGWAEGLGLQSCRGRPQGGERPGRSLPAEGGGQAALPLHPMDRPHLPSETSGL